jgi:hypothetical protein
MHGGPGSWSGKTILLVSLAGAYYLALNAVLISELVERVRQGSEPPAARQLVRVEASHTLEPSASCSELAGPDGAICRAEALLGRAAGKLNEQRRERRAAHEARRAIQPALAGNARQE